MRTPVGAEYRGRRAGPYHNGCGVRAVRLTRRAVVRRFSLTYTKTVVDDAAVKPLQSQKRPPRPTDAELAILRVLWVRGPSTVRQVHEALAEGRPTGYTTTLKLLQIMAEKGLVQRDDSDRSHVFTPRLAEEQTQRQLLQDLLDRAFGGSATKLVMQALSTRRASPEELVQIRALLDEAEERKR
jgi:predicted transcriptional regulator